MSITYDREAEAIVWNGSIEARCSPALWDKLTGDRNNALHHIDAAESALRRVLDDLPEAPARRAMAVAGRLRAFLDEAREESWRCDWQPDDLNPGPECPYCAGEMCGRLDGLGCTHNIIERHGYPDGYPYKTRADLALEEGNDALDRADR